MADGCLEFNHPRLAAIYDAVCPPGLEAVHVLRRVAEFRPRSLIDFGCGTGALTVELARRVASVTGVEPAQSMLAIARVRPGGGRVRWVNGGQLALDGLSADAVVMTAHVAQFMVEDEEWSQTLVALARVLPSGGKLLFDSRNPADRVWERYTRDRTLSRVDAGVEGMVAFHVECVSADGRVAVHDLHYLFERDGEELVSRNRMVYRSEEELRAGLDAAGFDVQSVSGDWDGQPMTMTSPEIIITARRR